MRLAREDQHLQRCDFLETETHEHEMKMAEMEVMCRFRVGSHGRE